MVDGAKIATACSVAVSLLMVAISVTTVILLRNDVRDLELELMGGMREFNVGLFIPLLVNVMLIYALQNIANDAWDEMMSMQRSSSISRQLDTPPVEALVASQSQNRPFDSFFRPSRQTELPKQCNCGVQPNNCPSGPPGPPGLGMLPIFCLYILNREESTGLRRH